MMLDAPVFMSDCSSTQHKRHNAQHWGEQLTPMSEAAEKAAAAAQDAAETAQEVGEVKGK